MEEKHIYYGSYLGTEESSFKCSAYINEPGTEEDGLRIICTGEIPMLPKFTPLIIEGEMDGKYFEAASVKIDPFNNNAWKFIEKSECCKKKELKKLSEIYTSNVLQEIINATKEELVSSGISETGAIGITTLTYQIKNGFKALKYLKAFECGPENIGLFFKTGIDIAELKKNPYKVGFNCKIPLSICDKIMEYELRKKRERGEPFTKFEPHSSERCWYVIKTAALMIERTGNSYVSFEEFEQVIKTVTKIKDSLPFCRDLVLVKALCNPIFTIDGNKVYLTEYLDYEKSSIRNLERIASGETEHTVISNEMREKMKKLDKSQREAVTGALNSTISIITGGPGTGKTTITKQIVDILEKNGENILLAAPTGRAAAMMKGRTKHPASTIHKLLGIHGISSDKFVASFNEEIPLQCNTIIIDESSMVDLSIFSTLLKAIPDDCRVIFIGDADQLPSVSPGDILKNLILSGRFPVYKLEKTHRQINGSVIIENAHRIMSREHLIDGSDFITKTYETEDELKKELMSDFCSLYNEKNPDSFQILSPTKKGLLGTDSINETIIKNKRPTVKDKFVAGDKVMTIRNVYNKSSSYINGDVGIIEDPGKEAMEIKLLDGEHIFVSERSDVKLAYAITIHKSQGSEYDTAAIVIGKEGSKMLTTQLLYTAITRARKRVIIYILEENKDREIKESKKRNCGISERLRSL